MQTMAASVGGMAGLGVLIQTMIWLGLAEPPTWQLIAYFLCVGMFGAGVGMLYTPVVIDRMQLKFPSGLAVANILRALTDPVLLRRSVARLGGGFGLGAALTVLTEKGGAAFLSAINFSASTFGAGIIVGARIGVPAIVVGLIGLALTPWLREIGLLGPNDPWRKVGFLISLGAILGAAIVDIGLILREALARRSPARPAAPAADWQRLNTHLLIAWVLAWGTGVVFTARAFPSAASLCVARHRPRLRLRAGERHQHGHFRQQPYLFGVRRQRHRHGARRTHRSPDRPDRRLDHPHEHGRRRRHAAGPLDRCAPRY